MWWRIGGAETEAPAREAGRRAGLLRRERRRPEDFENCKLPASGCGTWRKAAGPTPRGSGPARGRVAAAGLFVRLASRRRERGCAAGPTCGPTLRWRRGRPGSPRRSGWKMVATRIAHSRPRLCIPAHGSEYRLTSLNVRIVLPTAAPIRCAEVPDHAESGDWLPPGFDHQAGPFGSRPSGTARGD